MAKMENTDNDNIESRILGTIYGNCIGDAIGLLTEFMVKTEANTYYGRHVKSGLEYDQKVIQYFYYGKHVKSGLEYDQKVPDFHRSRWKTGDWTDDSDQMILIMDSLHAKEGIDAVDFGQRLLGWARHGFPELGDFAGMGIGATTHHVLHHKEFKTDPHAAAKYIWEKSGYQTAPNGAVMRTSLLGIYQFDDTEKVISNCMELCKVTHADPRCQASCIAACCAISFMLQQKHLSKGKFDITKIIDDCFDHAKKVFPGNQKAEIKELKKYMYVKSLKDLKLDESGKIGYTFKCLGAGFWALQQNDFRKALTDLIMEGGDADTNGAVAGALLGCKLGHSQLPPSWLNKLYHKQWLDNKIYSFLERFVPHVKSISLVEYKEIPTDNEVETEKRQPEKRVRKLKKESNQPDTASKPSRNSTEENIEQKEQSKDNTDNQRASVDIPHTDNIPFVDEDENAPL